MNPTRTLAAAVSLAALFSTPPLVLAQEHIPARVEIAWDRYYTYDQISGHMRAIAAAYPDLVSIVDLGTSGQGRPILLAIVNAPRTGPHSSKPAMWIDGNVHGNEIQSAEAVVYSLWYLTKSYGKNERLTTLLDECAFYLLPSQNPDGREHWFSAPNTPSSSRSNLRPEDDDQDGLADEDGPDDLDADGSITQMWKHDPDGDWVRSRTDPRVFIRLRPGEKAADGDAWSLLGPEGIDNDGDGRINEDGPGGDDMNRNWPSDWQPGFVQGGAGLYPLSNPEPRAIAAFFFAHPNIAAVQSYHNSGGMILRGPGAAYRDALYPGEDRAVYDEIARIGEQLLPYYRSMVIYRDLYTVHGGFVTWTAEGLGIFSFTNELWSDAKYFQREGGDATERSWLWRDRIAFGQTFKDYTEFDHPKYGKILVGGPNKWSSRVTPTFLLEEECHRNFAFTMYHADQMPRLTFGRTDIAPAGPGLWSVTLEVRNDRLIPTRSAIARAARFGAADILSCDGAPVISSGTLNSWFDEQMDAVRFEPHRLLNDRGIPARSRRIFRFIVQAIPGDNLRFTYQADKARTINTTIVLQPTPPRP